MLPHGGPADRDADDFDWWSHALADQGYAVCDNYRGSLVTERLLERGFGQWGRKMQTDLSDGVRYLAKEGTVDAARVCIVGASYGGYAALAGAAAGSWRYAARSQSPGIGDLKRMSSWSTAKNWSSKQ